LIIQTEENEETEKKITKLQKRSEIIIVVPSYYIFAAFSPNLPNHFCTNQAHFVSQILTVTSPAFAPLYLHGFLKAL